MPIRSRPASTIRGSGPSTPISSPCTSSTSAREAVVAGAGAGAAVAYVRGDLDTTLGASLSQSIRAANLAVEELQFVKVSETKDAVQATIIARDAADKKIEFYLSSLSEGATSLKIRVGTFGEDELQARILAQIRSHL